MGLIVDTGIEGLEIELRKESCYISEPLTPPKHIFVYNKDGLVEISYEFLKKLLKYFNQHPDQLEVRK